MDCRSNTLQSEYMQLPACEMHFPRSWIVSVHGSMDQSGRSHAPDEKCSSIRTPLPAGNSWCGASVAAYGRVPGRLDVVVQALGPKVTGTVFAGEVAVHLVPRLVAECLRPAVAASALDSSWRCRRGILRSVHEAPAVVEEKFAREEARVDGQSPAFRKLVARERGRTAVVRVCAASTQSGFPSRQVTCPIRTGTTRQFSLSPSYKPALGVNVVHHVRAPRRRRRAARTASRR